jgi:DNA-dependent RNA polymerase auxiliary subunit epsilon
MNIYRQLAEGGGYNLPFLVHLSSPDGVVNIYLINDNTDLEYDGVTYSASNFTYSPNMEGESTLNVELVEHDEIIDLLEENEYFNVEVIGVFNGEEVEEIGQFRHKYGEGTWEGAKLEMKLDKDDRGGMTFPALIFNSYNNRGNN